MKHEVVKSRDNATIRPAHISLRTKNRNRKNEDKGKRGEQNTLL